jgi:hypothetical protein
MGLSVPRCIDEADEFAALVRAYVGHARMQHRLKFDDLTIRPRGTEQLVELHVAHWRGDLVLN